MKISILTRVARQVEGEFVFVNVEKAHADPEVLRKYLQDNPLPRTEKIGEVNCVVEYGIISDIEVEGFEL